MLKVDNYYGSSKLSGGSKNRNFLPSWWEFLTCLWFEGSKDSLKHIFDDTSRWLDLYFNGIIPDFTPEYKVNNITPFRKQVIDIMNKIPYGNVMTYNDIAKIIAKNNNIKKMSAQAVGNAIGSNPICIIIPCHRVVGVNNKLTGYGGGLDNKISLLSHEGIEVSKYKR